MREISGWGQRRAREACGEASGILLGRLRRGLASSGFILGLCAEHAQTKLKCLHSQNSKPKYLSLWREQAGALHRVAVSCPCLRRLHWLLDLAWMLFFALGMAEWLAPGERGRAQDKSHLTDPLPPARPPSTKGHPTMNLCTCLLVHR